MVNQNKVYVVENLTQKINDAKALYLTDYRGLKVNQMVELRQKVKESGGELQVIKNRLLKLALKGSSHYKEVEVELTGPTAALWANEDEISPLKTLAEFAKEAGLPKLKIGFLDKKALSNTEVEQLSKVPSLNELYTKLVGLTASPIFGLVHALNWNRRGLVCTLKSLAETRKE
ncbi:50S ribosomal protein L10 [Patescibacteria group bacterium]|nr:50S ribosomal protein L10 [Patescibacteria group bacterium]